MTTESEKWFAVQPEHAGGWWVVSTDEDGYTCIDESGDGGFEETTARRIARVPDLEALTISQAEEIKRLREALKVYAGGVGAYGVRWEPIDDKGAVARAALNHKETNNQTERTPR